MNAAARLVSAGLTLALAAACQGTVTSTPSPTTSSIVPATSAASTAPSATSTAAATTNATVDPTLAPTAAPTTLAPTATPTAALSPTPTADPTPAPSGLVIDWRQRGGDHGLGRLYDDSDKPTFHSGAVFANRYFIAGFQEDDDYNDVAAVWSSSDGLTWELANIPGLQNIYSTASNDAGLLVTAESSGHGAQFWLTTNGADWEPIAVSDDPAQYGFHIAATSAGFVALGTGTWVSTDGRAWQPVTTASAADLLAAGVVAMSAYGERVVALTGGGAVGGPLVVWTSTNLMDWTMAGPLTGTRNVRDPVVAGGPLGWIVAGYDQDREHKDLMFASADGLAWQQVTPAIGPVSDVFVDDAGFVAVGFLHIGTGCALDPADIQGFTWTSLDGRSWNAMPLDEFLHKRIDHLFRDGRTLIGVGLVYDAEEDGGALSGGVWTARLPAIPPAGPGPTAAPTPTLDPGGCGPG